VSEKRKIKERAAWRFPAAAAIQIGEYPFSSRELIEFGLAA